MPGSVGKIDRNSAKSEAKGFFDLVRDMIRKGADPARAVEQVLRSELNDRDPDLSVAMSVTRKKIRAQFMELIEKNKLGLKKTGRRGTTVK